MTKTLTSYLSSAVSFPISLWRNSSKMALASGSGFFYLKDGNYFFITAKHNLTGTNVITKENFGMPDRMCILMYAGKKGLYKGYKTLSIELYDEEGNSKWLEHPRKVDEIDVVAIRVEINDADILIKPINNISFDDDLPIEIGMDLFILGYPHGYYASPTLLPIWKRGTLASEHCIDINGLPLVYIDTAGAKGMSGAPVIAAIKNGTYFPVGKSELKDMVLGSGQKFVGIYTGRRTDKETEDPSNIVFNAQLGLVWKTQIIDEIVEAYSEAGL